MTEQRILECISSVFDYAELCHDETIRGLNNCLYNIDCPETNDILYTLRLATLRTKAAIDSCVLLQEDPVSSDLECAEVHLLVIKHGLVVTLQRLRDLHVKTD